MESVMARPDTGQTHFVFSLKLTKFFDYLGAAVLEANSPSGKFGLLPPKAPPLLIDRLFNSAYALI